MPTNSTGCKIYDLRRQSGYSQEELADLIGVSRQTVSKWELEEATPNADNLVQLSKVFDVSVDYFISTNDNAVLAAEQNKTVLVNEQQKEEYAAFDIEQQRELAKEVLTQILQSEIAAAKEKKTKRNLICLSIIGTILAIICIPFGFIIFTPNKGGIETLHTFDIADPLLLIFVCLMVLVAVTIITIIIIAVKRHKSNNVK